MATGDLIYLLAIFDRAAANLERLQAVWDKASPLLPSDAQLGSDPRHEDLARKWDDLLSGIPPIDGFGINESLPDFEGIGQSFLDYREIGELPTSVWREVERPGRLLDEYRYRLRRARAGVIRDRVFQLRNQIDRALPCLVRDVDSESLDHVDDPPGGEHRGRLLGVGDARWRRGDPKKSLG